MALDIERFDIPGLILAKPRRFGDERGWFSEVYSASAWAEHGVAVDFVQDNHSFTASPGTLRGLHFQAPPHGQDKLVRVARGRVFDVAVDLRVGSPTYGQWAGAELSAEGGEQLLVPVGLAHGFLTLTPDCEVLYKCSSTYAPSAEGGLAWDDPQVAIAWPDDIQVEHLNDRDRGWPTLDELASPFRFAPEPVVRPITPRPFGVPS
ncbi:MAG: dTDP-4-dehydrorhamnose 3,5-epimerase [Planctomycetota bacterium]